jgi:hypothetical protein
VWPVALSGRLPVVALVGHHPTNKLIGRGLILHRRSFTPGKMPPQVISGIRPRFQGLSQSAGQIAHVLLTRSPLIHPKASPFDLHVLSTPPAFVLSQDQTLRECFSRKSGTTGRNNPRGAQRPRCVIAFRLRKDFSQRNHIPDKRRDGVSTYLALTFGTLLSSQRTEAAIGSPSPATPPGFPFVVSPTLADAFRSELPSPFRAHTFPRVSSRRLCQRTGLPRVEQIAWCGFRTGSRPDPDLVAEGVGWETGWSGKTT